MGRRMRRRRRGSGGIGARGALIFGAEKASDRIGEQRQGVVKSLMSIDFRGPNRSLDEFAHDGFAHQVGWQQALRENEIVKAPRIELFFLFGFDIVA